MARWSDSSARNSLFEGVFDGSRRDRRDFAGRLVRDGYAGARPGPAGTDTIGTIIEDSGDTVGVPVDVGHNHTVVAARRWAIATEGGGLPFADSEHLTAE